jgi:hypothetical protein
MDAGSSRFVVRIAAPMSPRRWLLSVALVLDVAGGYLSAGPPRLTLLNASLVVEYPWPRGAAAVACALGIAGLAALVSRPVLRRIGLVLALGPLLVGAHLLWYRLEADNDALVSRGALGTTTLAWRAVRGIDLAPETVSVRGDASTISIDTADFSPEQRATLERTLARHVREQGGRGATDAPN